MKIKTQTILTIMHVLSWIVCCGLIAQAVAILTSYTVSIINPQAAKNLYKGLNLFSDMQNNFWQYTSEVIFLTVTLGIKAYVAYLVAKVLSSIKIASPFTIEVSKRLENISYFVLILWVITILYNTQVRWKIYNIAVPGGNQASEEFLLVAGVVFVMSQIFKKGVEIQSENELTI